MRTALALPFLGAALMTAGALFARARLRPALLDRIRSRGY
jgi:hypothetical protein